MKLKIEQIKTFELNKLSDLQQRKIASNNYDLDSSLSESVISNNENPSKEGMRLRLKGGLKNYTIIKAKSKLKMNGKSLLKTRLFVKTIENIVSKRISFYCSQFMNNLKIRQVNPNSDEVSKSFTKALKSSFKNRSERLTLNPCKYSFECTTGGSTRASIIFGKKERNMINETNFLECLPEGNSIWTDESLLKPSKSYLEIKDGLKKINRFMRK